MKRSTKVALWMMVPATGILMATCGESSEEAMVFTDPAECAQFSGHSLEECTAEFAAAKELHPIVAPKYDNLRSCEADFGSQQCEPWSGGTGLFMPIMAGYLTAKMLNRDERRDEERDGGYAGGGSGRSAVTTQPLYKSRDDRVTFRASNNSEVAYISGRVVHVKPSHLTTYSRGVVSRGGFGAQAAARSSFGG